MNAGVSKTINGIRVTAKPVFKGDGVPAYWAGIVNERTLPQTFTSPQAVFRFVSARRGH